MAPPSAFMLFEEKLMQVVEKIPKTSCLEEYVFTIYLEMKRETDIVQQVGAKNDSPSLNEKEDRCGLEARKRKEKNRLYTWIRNRVTRKSFVSSESFTEKWTRFADANPIMVVQYIRSRPGMLEQLQSVLDISTVATPEDTLEEPTEVATPEDTPEEPTEDLPTIKTPVSYPKRKRIPRVIFTPSSSKKAEKQEKKKRVVTVKLGKRKRKAPSTFTPKPGRSQGKSDEIDIS